MVYVVAESVNCTANMHHMIRTPSGERAPLRQLYLQFILAGIPLLAAKCPDILREMTPPKSEFF